MKNPQQSCDCAGFFVPEGLAESLAELVYLPFVSRQRAC